MMLSPIWISQTEMQLVCGLSMNKSLLVCFSLKQSSLNASPAQSLNQSLFVVLHSTSSTVAWEFCGKIVSQDKAKKMQRNTE